MMAAGAPRVMHRHALCGWRLRWHLGVRRYGPCEAGSLKERMKRAVALLGAREVDDIIAKEGKIEVRAVLCWSHAKGRRAACTELLVLLPHQAKRIWGRGEDLTA